MTSIRNLAVFTVVACALLFSSPALANNPVPSIVPPSPSAAAPGGAAFTLTVQGANFVSGAVVNWNGSPRSTTFVSTTELTAAILATDIATQGTATVTVTNPVPGGGISNQEFFSIVPPASRISFGSYTVTNQAALTSNVVEGDFNNDGKLDIAVASGSAVYVLLGNGDGTFQAAIGTAGPAGAALQGLYVADANNDGKLDLFATGSTSSTNLILTFFGKGDGTFQAPVETDFAPESGLALDAFVFADFNGDGMLDAAHTNFGQIVIFYGNADGSFRPGSVTGLNGSYVAGRALAAGDFRGQGALSLVIQMSDPASMANRFIAVFDTVAGVPSPYPAAYPEGTIHTYSSCCSVVLADFNGDGKLDIADMHPGVTLGAQPVLEIMLNTGSTTQSSFGSPVVVANSNTVQGLTLLAADFNGDGFLDLAAGGLVFFGRGDGTFPSSTGSPNSSVISDFLLAGDFNGDGKPDIITAKDSFSGPATTALGLLLQIPPAPDFSGSVSPSVATIALNNTTSYTVNLQALFGFTSDVTLSVSGLPAGVTGSFQPATVTGGTGSSTLTLTANGSVAFGTYTINIAGAGGGVTHSSDAQLVVNASVGDFTGSVSPDPQNIAPGQSAVYTISISPTGGFTGDVALTLSGAVPTGSIYRFSPATITGGSGTSTLTISTPTGLAPSVSYVTVIATSGTIVKKHTIALGVNPSGGDFTGTYTGSLSSPPSGLVEYIFSLQPINGYSQPVTISFGSLPPGATSDAPISTVPGTPVGVHVTLNNVASGTYPILVTMAGPGVVHEVTVYLVVN